MLRWGKGRMCSLWKLSIYSICDTHGQKQKNGFEAEERRPLEIKFEEVITCGYGCSGESKITMESGYIKKKDMKDMSNSGHQYLRLKVSLLAAWFYSEKHKEIPMRTTLS